MEKEEENPKTTESADSLIQKVVEEKAELPPPPVSSSPSLSSAISTKEDYPIIPENLIEEKDETGAISETASKCSVEQLHTNPHWSSTTTSAATVSEKSPDNHNNGEMKSEAIIGSIDVPPVEIGHATKSELPASIPGNNPLEEEDRRGLMLVVGSESTTNKVMTILKSINDTGIKITVTPDLKPEDAVRWKNEDVTYVLYAIDYSNQNGLKEVDEQLTYLHTNYLLPFERIAFLLAHEPKDRDDEAKTITASSIASFMSKFRQPLINIIFDDGWEDDTSLQKQMRMFLNRFQELDSNDNANISNFCCPSILNAIL